MDEKIREVKHFNLVAIDDSNDILLILEEAFSNENFNVITYQDARVALSKIDAHVDVIILDLMMPKMSGYDFLKEFRNMPEFNNIPVIVLTAACDDRNVIVALFEVGANDFVKKPFFNEELIARVKTHARLKRSNEALIQRNRALKEELDMNKRLYEISIDYAMMIESTLQDKIKNLLKENASTQDNIYKIIEENKSYKEEIQKLQLVCDTLVSHDSVLEDELDSKLKNALELATKDHLTQVYNRVKFYEVFYEELKELQSNPEYIISVIMYDIDHFKLVNDKFGHDVGDIVLKELSQVINMQLDSNSYFFRWGGEEFIILNKHRDIHRALQLAEKLRKVVDESEFSVVDHITCSFGVTEFYNHKDSADVFLKRVDDMLYEAKNSGRNCVRPQLKKEGSND